MENQQGYPSQQNSQTQQGYQSQSSPNVYQHPSTNQTVIVNAGYAQKPKSKWVALLLCFFFGAIGAHKFYEEKTGMGILYLFTLGLFGIGVIIDFITLLFKPSEYMV